MTGQHRLFGRIQRALVATLIIALAGLSWNATPMSARQLVTSDGSEFVCFPSCSSSDGKFLVVAGSDPTTLAGVEVVLGLNFAAANNTGLAEFAIFDGDRSPVQWDVAYAPLSRSAPELVIEMFADPLGLGPAALPPSALVATWDPSSPGYPVFVENQWTALSVTHAPSALDGGGVAYRYSLRITPKLLSDFGWNAFKVRTAGTLALLPSPFAFLGSVVLSGPDRSIIYPNWNGTPAGLVGSPYDGQWTFGFNVPAPQAELSVWDGDMDYGDIFCNVRDTDDPDSPLQPVFAVGAVNEGVGVGDTTFCNATGLPADDSQFVTFRRVPKRLSAFGVGYELVDPRGRVFINTNLSGQREWEKFTVTVDPSATAFDADNPITPCLPDAHAARPVTDCQSDQLPAGVYEVRLDGMDMSNLNFWKFEYRALGLPPSGPPPSEDAFYRIERYVWYDTDRDGVFDSNEQGIPGVSVVRRDTNTGVMQTAVTDSTGRFIFRVPTGDYSLEVVGSNFGTGKPLNGLYFTGNNGYGNHNGEFAEVPGMGPDQPYERRDFGYVRNTPPTATDDTGVCFCTGSATINVLENDSDIDQQALTLTAITQPAHGVAVIDSADGTVTYTATAGYTGADAFTYTVTDASGGTATGTVTIDVVNNPPVLGNDSALGNFGSPVTVNVLQNDSDPDGGQTIAVASATNGANGTTVVNSDGTITYTPNPGFSGTDTFSYTVSDKCAEATAVVTIVVNTPPTPQPDAGACLCTGATTIDLKANDTDADNDALTVTAVTQPAHGTATLNANGTVSYAPTNGYTGSDSFTYTVSDGRGGTAVGVVTITNNNQAPILVNDAATAAAVTPVTVNVLANDSDPDGQALAVRSVTQGANGTVAINANGTVTYTPNTGFSGTDTFSYTVFDGCAEVTATVTITVTPPPPTCDAGGYTTYTPGGWGAKPSGNNPGALLKNNFSTVYPGGSVTIGSGTKVLTFTSAKAIEVFLPLGGNPGVLSASATNPTTSVGGPFIGHLLSLQLAADFSRRGALKTGLGNMAMLSGPLAGQTVTQILALANGVAGGTVALPSGVSFNTLHETLVAIIMNYHEGTVNGGLLGCGGGTPPPPPPPPPVDPPPATGSGVCSGGVTKLVLKYIGGGSPAGVVSGQRTAPGNGPIVAAQVSGGLYTFATTEMGGLFDSVSGGRLANNLTLYIGATKVGDVHTSCSTPIYPGMKIGNQFEIVALWTRGAGLY